MRHQKAGRKLGRNSAHRRAMFSNMVASLVTHGRIETTEAKAKELRRTADRTINWATTIRDILGKDRARRSADEQARVVHAMRMAGRVLKDVDALRKLFHEVGPGFGARPGGYTRVLKTRFRRGDAAPMAIVELVDGNGAGRAAAPSEPAGGGGKTKGKAAAAKAEGGGAAGKAKAKGAGEPGKAARAKPAKKSEAKPAKAKTEKRGKKAADTDDE
jgi:large subunit ribosomal protein L17